MQQNVRNIKYEKPVFRKTLILIELLAAVIIILFTVFQILSREKTMDVVMMSGLFAAFILIIHTLKLSSASRNRKTIAIVGIALVTTGIIVAISTFFSHDGVSQPVIVTILIIMGMMLIIRGISPKTASDYQIQDERTLRIGTYGLAYSWYLTFLTIAVIGWLIGTDTIEVTGDLICLLLIILMPMSAMIFQSYFNRQGDVY